MNHNRPIPAYAKKNFRTLCEAAIEDRICLMSVFDASLGKPATVICAVNYHQQEDCPYEFVPLATMVDDAPYSRFITPIDTREAGNE